METKMKKLILAVVGLAFAFAMSSCNEQNGQSNDCRKNAEKQEKHTSRGW